MLTLDPEPVRDSRKVVVRVPNDVFVTLDRLARSPERSLWLVYDAGPTRGATRYAEVARVLLASEVLSTAPQSTRIAVAVLSNATLILAAAFARLTYSLQGDLLNVSATAARVDQATLLGVRDESTRRRKGQNLRKEGQDKSPIINLTLDGWLNRELVRLAAGVSDDALKESRLRSKLAYTVIGLLETATERRDVIPLIQSYAKAVLRVRNALETAVASERDAIREYLQQVRPLR